MLELTNLETDRVTAFRNKYERFIFDSFDYDFRDGNLIITFLFKIPPKIEFRPSTKIKNVSLPFFSTLDESVIENFIFHLGLIEMLSYWKATCSPIIDIEAGTLSASQMKWWEGLLMKGLGEFFYKNKIDFTQKNFIKIKCSNNREYKKDMVKHKDRYLVLNGGGKDSVVSLQILKELKKEVGVLMVNPTKAALDLNKAVGVKDEILVEREIDKKLLELNSKNYLNGHTPFSAYLAFLSSLCGLLFDYKKSVSSNERSSNEENVVFLGSKINHQYSKTFEFEKSFRSYLRENLSGQLDYFSILRSLYEIQISKVFAQYKHFLTLFKSCNIGQKTGSWCGRCPKCLSVYILLYPFLKQEELIKVFGHDLYRDNELKNLLMHLVGLKKPKPFECVGTYEELMIALELSILKIKREGNSLPSLLRYVKNNLTDKTHDSPSVLKGWDEENFIERDIAEATKNKISEY